MLTKHSLEPRVGDVHAGNTLDGRGYRPVAIDESGEPSRALDDGSGLRILCVQDTGGRRCGKRRGIAAILGRLGGPPSARGVCRDIELDLDRS